MVRSKLLVWLLFISFSSVAQVNRYFVYFKDKAGTPYSVNSPAQFLSAKSIARRQLNKISVLEEDLPVNPDYVGQVKLVGANTFYTSKWFNGVIIESDAALVMTISSLPFVKEVLLIAPGQKLSGGRVGNSKQKKNTGADQLANQFQLEQIGLDVMHAESIHGEGISIAVFDSGFIGVNTSDPFQSILTDGRVKQTFNFVTNTSTVYQSDDHGTEVLSVMAAYSENAFVGGVYKADYFLYVTEDKPTEYRIEEFNWTIAAERADSAGVEVINSSLGYNYFDDSSMDYTKEDLDGNTAIITKAARKAIEKGIIVVTSAGNEGNNSWKVITPPADANGILAVGSVTSQNSLSTFSSLGPTVDNRIKPEVVALGSGTSVVKSNGSFGTASGTSLASPLVASLAAGIRQAYPELTAFEIYDAIIHSADQSLTPDNLKGYGLPHYLAVKNYLFSKSNEEEISLYPNPAYGNSINLVLKSLQIYPSEITIYDVQGRRVEEFSHVIDWVNNPLEYDISKLQNGVYFLRVQHGNKLTVLKLIRI
jgi:hypothetical protein